MSSVARKGAWWFVPLAARTTEWGRGSARAAAPNSSSPVPAAGRLAILGRPIATVADLHSSRARNRAVPGRGLCPQWSPAGANSHPELRHVSVLFVDLVGFTALSEKRDAEDVRELLDGYFEQAKTIVSRHGGTIQKFIGDAVMAVWGVPVAREDDAERAVRAGLGLVEAVAALGDDVGAPGLVARAGWSPVRWRRWLTLKRASSSAIASTPLLAFSQSPGPAPSSPTR